MSTQQEINRLYATNDDKRVLRKLFVDSPSLSEANKIVRQNPSSFGEGDKRRLVKLSQSLDPTIIAQLHVSPAIRRWLARII